VIELDSALIQSALENVVRNALRHTAEGTAVDVSIADESRCVRIAIDDHGPGIPLEAISKIFEPFYRVEDSRSTRSGSGGIGLAIAERSVRLHGGKITARNREGGGLRVEMLLPSAV
jgi:two-component system sensor histidine kinase CpxA